MLAYCSAEDGHNYYHNIRKNVKSVWGDIRPSNQSKLAEFIQELSTITNLETVLKTIDEFSKTFDNDAFDLSDVSGAMNAAMGISSQSNSTSSDPKTLSLPKVSPQCWKHTMMTVTGLFGRKSWAIKSKSHNYHIIYKTRLSPPVVPEDIACQSCHPGIVRTKFDDAKW